MNARRLITSLITIAILALPALLLGYANTPPINQAYNSQIIDDGLFSNTQTMSAAAIQNFLNAKVPTCDTNHQGGLSQFPPPYTCLKDYVDPTTGKKAAQLIYDEAQSRGLNPQVILVTLEKEQGLVTDTWPYPSQYKSAMGYGCPESQSVCDSQYFGFYNQVHLGAGLLRAAQARSCGDTTTLPGYSQIPTELHQGQTTNPASAGRVDGVATYIGTCATGSLYNYTPHRPDSAYTQRNGTYYYGNYNFINFFTSWFGPTTGAFLATSPGNSNIYVVSGTSRFFIPTPGLLQTYASVLGSPKTIDPGFLASFTDTAHVNHIARQASNSTIYLVDIGHKYAFTTCQQLADFGGNCASVTDLPDNVLDSFPSTANVSNFIYDQYGRIYKVEAGAKRPIPDSDTLNAYGYNAQPRIGLYDDAINMLPDGTPVLRDFVMVTNTDTGQLSVLLANTLHAIPDPAMVSDWNFNTLAFYRLAAWQLSTYSVGNPVTAWAQDSGGTKYLMDGGAKHPIGGVGSAWASSFSQLSDYVIGRVPTGGNVGVLVRRPSDNGIFLIESGKRRLIPTGEDFYRSGYNPAAIVNVSNAAIDRLAPGPFKFGALRMLKTASSPDINVIDGTNAYHITTVAQAQAFGLDLGQLWTVDPASFYSYPGAANLSNYVTDGTNRFVADRGFMRPIASDAFAAYNYNPSQFLTLNPLLITNLPRGGNLTVFIKGSGSTIYYVESGYKRPFMSFSSYMAYNGGNTSNTISISDDLLNSVPTGAPIY